MKIVVTGGLGLIGHNVVSRLENLGHDVLIIDNLTNYGIIPQAEIDYLVEERLKKIKCRNIKTVDISSTEVDTIFAEFKPEIVMHLASFPRQKVVNANPQLGAKTMVEGLLNLLELSVKHNINKFLYISSSMIYGEFKDNVKEDAICKPEGQYGIMKYMGEKIVQDYERKGLLKAITIRPSAVYGPLDVEDRVISKFLLTAMRGGVLKVNGIHEVLDFTYVDDAADGIVAATLCEEAYGATYNITKSHSVSLYQAAQIAVKMAGSGSIEVREKDADFPSRGALDITSARETFGFDPKVDVEEGFVKYYEWLKNSGYYNQ
jgi:nucleoside-diphosphate-sugar epimerase